MLKTQLSISLDQELADFVNIYAQENRTTASELITQLYSRVKTTDPGRQHGYCFFQSGVLSVGKRRSEKTP